MNLISGTTNQNQMITLIWIPRLTATLSSLGSMSIMYIIISARKEKLTKTANRLMLGLSTFDALHSIAYAMTTLVSPRDSKFYGAIGNDRTCSAQGFLLILGLAVPMYNTSLSLFYLLIIRFNVRRATFSAKIEPFLHAVSILAPLTLAIVSLSVGGINSESVACYLSFSDSSIATDTLWLLIIGGISLCFIINLYSMITISRYVIIQSNSVRRFSYTTTQKARRASEKREVVVQSLFYTGAFFATFIFPCLIVMFNLKGPFLLEVCNEIFYPLQGFWNFLLYTRPNINRVKKINPDKAWIHIYWEVIFHARKEDEPIIDFDGVQEPNELVTPNTDIQ